MTPLPHSPSFTPPPVGLPAKSPASQRPSRLMAGIYHDIGMAAVAISLDLEFESLEPAAHDAVKRGSRYIYLMPKRQSAPEPQAVE
jgi:hypothetical protein